MIYNIPLGPARDISLTADFPLTEQDWDHFMAVLDAMKPGLTKPAETQKGTP